VVSLSRSLQQTTDDIVICLLQCWVVEGRGWAAHPATVITRFVLSNLACHPDMYGRQWLQSWPYQMYAYVAYFCSLLSSSLYYAVVMRTT